jgi:hypothetical protein
MITLVLKAENSLLVCVLWFFIEDAYEASLLEGFSSVIPNHLEPLQRHLNI